eukprot:5587572-Pyramimonas_sp.AAC.1
MVAGRARLLRRELKLVVDGALPLGRGRALGLGLAAGLNLGRVLRLGLSLCFRFARALHRRLLGGILHVINLALVISPSLTRLAIVAVCGRGPLRRQVVLDLLRQVLQLRLLVTLCCGWCGTRLGSRRPRR